MSKRADGNTSNSREAGGAAAGEGAVRLTPRPLAAFAFLCGLVSLCPAARADEYHYGNMLIGDRAAGMGGAYTAVSDDATGLYYNPAGTAFTKGGNLSGSMNTFHLNSTRYKDALGSGKDWKRQSSSFLPNFFGVVQSVGNAVVGFSYAVSDSLKEDQDQVFRDPLGSSNTRLAMNFNQEDNTYNVGPSCAFALGPRLSVGATLYGHYRSQQLIENEVTTHFDTATFDWSNYYFETEEFGVRPIVGLIWEPVEKWAVGLRLARTFVLSSETRVQLTNKAADSNVVDSSTFNYQDRRQYPLGTTLGVAWFPTSSLALDADFSYYTEAHDHFRDKEPTWNVAVGLEYYLTPAWAVRSGFFTDRANTPKVVEGRESLGPHVDLYGASASLSHFTRSSSVTLGAAYSYGTGKDQIITGSTAAQDVVAQTLSVFLSASYRY